MCSANSSRARQPAQPGRSASAAGQDVPARHALFRTSSPRPGAAPSARAGSRCTGPGRATLPTARISAPDQGGALRCFPARPRGCAYRPPSLARAQNLTPPSSSWSRPGRVSIDQAYTLSVFCLMSVPLTLLGLLEREPSHGYDLKRDYDAFFGRGKQLPFGQVYATLAGSPGTARSSRATPSRATARTASATRSPTTGTAEVDDVAGRTGGTGAAPADGAVREGDAGADARQAAPALPRHPARRPSPAHARAHRAQADRPAGRRAARRPRPLPPGGGPPVDRPDVSPAGGTS